LGAICTEPPAFDRGHGRLERPTPKFTLALISPTPRAGPSLARRSTPAATSAAASTAARTQLAGVDGGLHALEIDLIELLGKRRVLEAALGQAPVQRHLAALEPDPHARARGLALAATAAGLAAADPIRARCAADRAHPDGRRFG
jgi:hypothetical protein